MRRRLATLGLVGALSAVAGLTGSTSAPARSTTAARTPVFATGPLQTGIVDVPPFLAPSAPTAFKRVKGTGATFVRLILFWKFVGLSAPERPANFNPTNPADPNYQWAAFDRQVQLAVRAGLQPIVGVQLAPAWAERSREGDPGTRSPDPAELAAFATAAAKRYGGRFQGLPRVRYWQAWNEPNYSGFLTPQSPDLYRQMVNAFADAVHGVHKDNVVIAGGTSPFQTPKVAVAPLDFMRDLLCVSADAAPRPTCSAKIKFDVWSHHPYTSGGPTHRAQRTGDVSIGDLPEMKKVLLAANRAGHIVTQQKLRFWVTEFSWDSNPPDPVAVPAQLHARWVAEALYRMWKVGISMVTWFQIRDDPLSETEFQSGFYYDSGYFRAKLGLRAFRFPFVAFTARGGVDVWGRTPTSRAATVIVERSAGRGWKRVAVLHANRYGIFQRRLKGTFSGSLRARVTKPKEPSLAFSLTRPPDRYYWPFGCGGILPCA
jgi:hypothetical protein